MKYRRKHHPKASAKILADQGDRVFIKVNYPKTPWIGFLKKEYFEQRFEKA